MRPRVLVAGMGNDLCRDDGFGIAAVREYAPEAPPGARVIETGTGGITLVQELMDGYDALVIVDAVERGGEPGTVYLLGTDVPDLDAMSEQSRREFLADMHYAVPSRALILARALAVLPPTTYILGCQPLECGLGMELSAPVLAGVREAVARLRVLVPQLVAAAAATIPAPTAASSG